MEKNAIIEQIQSVINEITDIEIAEIKADSAIMDDLDMSSMELLTMTADLEKIFHMKFSTKDLRNIITVDDIAEYILGT